MLDSRDYSVTVATRSLYKRTSIYNDKYSFYTPIYLRDSHLVFRFNLLSLSPVQHDAVDPAWVHRIYSR